MKIPHPKKTDRTIPSTTVDALAVIIDKGLMLENSAILQGQVGEQFIALQSMGIRAGVLAVSADTDRFERVIGRRLREAGVRVWLVPHTNFLGNMLRMARALRQVRSTHKIRSAYVRGLWGPVVLALAAPITRIRYVYDVRGSVDDETAAIGTNRLKRKIYLFLEGWGIRRAAHVSAVTRRLAETVCAQHALREVQVTP